MTLLSTRYNWRFYFKLICSLLIIITIIVFTFGYGSDLLRDPSLFWHRLMDGREELFIEGQVDNLIGWSKPQQLTHIAMRNLLLITTVGNVFAAVWLFNSAMNNEKEGQGKFDNYTWGIISLTLVWWISVLYNCSLIVTGDAGLMKWYNYISWILSHSAVQFCAMIYFVVFYKKYNVVKEKRQVLKLWIFAEIPLIGYMLFFTMVGMIAKATGAFAFFGDMSSDGHFPYDFFDFTNDNTNLHVTNSPQLQYVTAIFGFIIFNSIWIFGSYFISLKQYNKQNIEQK